MSPPRKPIRIKADGSDVEVHPGPKNEIATWDSVRLTLKAGTRTVLLDYLFLNLEGAYDAAAVRPRSFSTSLPRYDFTRGAT